MAKLVQGVALCALMVACRAEGHRALRQAGGGRILQATQGENKAFEQIYFSETMAEDATVVLLESGPFKLEASCRTTEHDYYWYSTYTTGSYDYSYTSHYLALDLTYTSSVEDYVYGPPYWWSSHPDEEVLVGPWAAGESRTTTVFQGYSGTYGDDFTLQSLSGNYLSIDRGDTAGIHRENSDWLPGGVDAFPQGIECMVAGFITYHIPAIHDA